MSVDEAFKKLLEDPRPVLKPEVIEQMKEALKHHLTKKENV